MINTFVFMFNIFANLSGSLENHFDFLSGKEMQFVTNIIELQKEKVIEITKRSDKHIVIEFDTTIVVLKPNGYVDQVWILGDADWISLETEEDSY
jgi:hypothetical protein